MEYVVTKETRQRVLYPIFAAYVADGAIMTIFGALLPYLIAENNMSYALAGGLLSFLTVGNLCASLYYPIVRKRWHQRRIIMTVVVFVPVVLLLFSWVRSVTLMYVLIAYLGFVKGNITIVNAQLCNTSTHSSTRYQNIMHCTFAIGAFSSPFIMSMLMMIGFGWRAILYILTAASFVIIAMFWRVDYSCLDAASAAEENNRGKAQAADSDRAIADGETHAGSKAGVAPRSGLSWLTVDFVLICAIQCIYYGVENVAQGWFVTYFQDTGIMTAQVATLMVSVTWVMMMLGRLFIATFCSRIPKTRILLTLFTGVFLSSFLMIAARSSIMATLSVAIIGLFLSGCYPTSFAIAGPIMGTNAAAMSIFTAVMSLGGIVIPWAIGVLGDNIGIASAMLLFVVAAGAQLVVAIVLALRARKRG